MNERTTESDDSAGALPPHLIGARLAKVTGDDAWRAPAVRLVTGGKSNLTFEVTSPAGSVIVRRPPTGSILPSAHDMAREARVQCALATTDIPVAQVLYLDEAGDDIGSPYYVMTKVEGLVVRDEFPPGFAEDASARLAIATSLTDTLARIHLLEPKAVGLEGFGRPQGFMQRQVRRWADQWQRSKSHDVAVVDELIARLGAMEFSSGRGRLVHGDYRLDNCLLDAVAVGRINAVLDWELATVGDPLADLGMLLFYWVQPGEPVPALTPGITASDGFPTRRRVADMYAAATGLDLEELPAYVAFAHLKFAVIAQGIAMRARDGAMAGQDFGDLDAEVLRIAQVGCERLNRKEI